MEGSVILIIVGVIAAFLALKFIKGVVKLAVLAAIVIAVIYFLSQGSL
ncbi:hypothetical protein V6R86_12370 [Sphingomonas kaistensis]|uniref:Uncharacterized protein n=1 Tax=Sphingomonas kaistensis TaxID=298708 RepID=A0ABZ2G2X5_9SPHN